MCYCGSGRGNQHGKNKPDQRDHLTSLSDSVVRLDGTHVEIQPNKFRLISNLAAVLLKRPSFQIIIHMAHVTENSFSEWETQPYRTGK
jgi:hypothetical protein